MLPAKLHIHIVEKFYGIFNSTFCLIFLSLTVAEKQSGVIVVSSLFMIHLKQLSGMVFKKF
tara:strand:- start:7 stop:189 length:183 start_codon:yes stop_codon:yes gene_type:complete